MDFLIPFPQDSVPLSQIICYYFFPLLPITFTFCPGAACKSPWEKVYGDFSVLVQLDSVSFWLFKNDNKNYNDTNITL